MLIVPWMARRMVKPQPLTIVIIRPQSYGNIQIWIFMMFFFGGLSIPIAMPLMPLIIVIMSPQIYGDIKLIPCHRHTIMHLDMDHPAWGRTAAPGEASSLSQPGAWSGEPRFSPAGCGALLCAARSAEARRPRGARHLHRPDGRQESAPAAPSDIGHCPLKVTREYEDTQVRDNTRRAKIGIIDKAQGTSSKEALRLGSRKFRLTSAKLCASRKAPTNDAHSLRVCVRYVGRLT